MRANFLTTKDSEVAMSSESNHLISNIELSAFSLTRWHPDILDLSRLVQEFVTFALLAGHPIAE